jgi:hypothetical protein
MQRLSTFESSFPAPKNTSCQSVNPITPDQIDVRAAIPHAVIKAFNTLISANHRNGQSIVLQKDIVERLVELGFTKSEIFNDKLLDVEEIYKDVGWIVKYDKPAYNETYEPFFVFIRNKNG